MSGTRLQTKSTPVTSRFPQWSSTNYYPQGTVVWSNLYDSDQIDLYVSLIAHISNDSDYSLYLKDSENDSEYYNENVWNHYASSRTLDSDERSFASLNNKIKHIQLSYDSDKSYIDSDVNWLSNVIPLLPDSESIDSDLKLARQSITKIEERSIFTFVDSDAQHNKILIWDSDNQKLITGSSVLSVNTFVPNADGNIPISFVKVISGNNDQKPDSEQSGSIYIITNDSDSEINGSSFVYDDGWKSIISPDRELFDKKFLKTAGSNKLIGSLYVSDTPTNLAQIVNKKYVDIYVKEAKQDHFGFFDSELLINTSAWDSENFVVTTEGSPSLKFFDEINNITIGEQPISDYEYFDYVTIDSDSDAFDVYVKNFSNSIEGTLLLYKNGVLESFSLVGASAFTNSGGIAGGFKLDDSSVQNFRISLVNPFDLTSVYLIKYNTHYGESVTITKTANTSDWFRNEEDLDYGIY